MALSRQRRFYILENLAEMDPDYIVDVLDISSRELMKAFPDKLEKHILEEYDDEDEDEQDTFEEDYYDGPDIT